MTIVIRPRRRLPLSPAPALLGFVLPLAHATVALAQAGGGAAPAGAGGGATVGTAGQGGDGTTTTTTVVQGQPTHQFFPGGVAPLPPGAVLGGGNTEFSSSRPITGSESDTFDFRAGPGGAQTVYGNPDSSFILPEGDRGTFTGTVPNAHVVRRGDTLWGICGFYFQNPYQWPRIWSYNAQIQNPNWIYPGDQVKLRREAAVALAEEPTSAGGRPPPMIDRRRQVGPDTIFLQSQAFIEEGSKDWGEITGAREDKLFLTDYDQIYIRVEPKHDVEVGQELTIYRPVKAVPGGRIVEIQGTAKIDQWNPKERIARAQIIETLDTVERGARVAPLVRRFEVVSPVQNQTNVVAKVLTSLHPFAFYAQDQIVFLDKGSEAGLVPGNRLVVVRQGDGFKQTHPKGSAAKRIAIEDESPAATETIPTPRDEQALPEEAIAELRVITVKKSSSMALVTSARREIEPGERAEARKGY